MRRKQSSLCTPTWSVFSDIWLLFPSLLISLSSFLSFFLFVVLASGLRHGHYICLTKVSGQWFCFDDDDIHLWSAEDVRTVYGSQYTGEKNGHLDGYILFYSQSDLETEVKQYENNK